MRGDGKEVNFASQNSKGETRHKCRFRIIFEFPYFLFLTSYLLPLRGYGVLFSLMGFPLRRENKLCINNN